MKKALFAPFVIFLTLSPLTSQAVSPTYMEYTHALSQGNGIAAPSMTSALTENPAGLSYNLQTKLLADVNSENRGLHPLSYGGVLFMGNGKLGLAAGLRRDNLNLNTNAHFGLSAGHPSMGMILGVAPHFRLEAKKKLTGFDYNAGILINPYGDFRLGGTVFDVRSGVGAFAGGLAATVSRSIVLSADATADRHMKGLTVKPSIQLLASSLQLSYGYGYRIDKDYPTVYMRRFHSFGLGYGLSENLHLQFYYNQLARYFVGAAFRI